MRLIWENTMAEPAGMSSYLITWDNLWYGVEVHRSLRSAQSVYHDPATLGFVTSGGLTSVAAFL